MKTYLLPALLIALTLLAALLAACGGNDLEAAIVGRWEGDSTTQNGTFAVTWEFFEDGTAILTVKSILGAADSFASRYRFEDDDTIILLEHEGDTDPGRRDVQMPDADTLILTAPVSGDQDVLRRAAGE